METVLFALGVIGGLFALALGGLIAFYVLMYFLTDGFTRL